MALFLARRISNDGKLDILLVSSIDKQTVEKTLTAIYPDTTIEVPVDDGDFVTEQMFNEQYGGIAILTTVD